MKIIPGDLQDPRVIDLLNVHETRMHAESGLGSSHVLSISGLQIPAIRFWTIWSDDGALLGFGALKRLSSDHGEIKSMHTAEIARGQGVAATMLRHLLAAAREAGFTRVSLETGSWPFFAPARKLYQSHGFTECGPFAAYRPDPNSTFLTLELEPKPA